MKLQGILRKLDNDGNLLRKDQILGKINILKALMKEEDFGSAKRRELRSRLVKLNKLLEKGHYKENLKEMF